VTRGSLLHQFPSRNELLVSAVTHLGEARFDAVVEQVRSTAGRKNRIDAIVDAMWDTFQGPLFVAATELWIAARTDPDLRVVLEPAERELGRRFRAGWDEVFAPVSRSREFTEMFDLLLSSMRGVAITRHFDSSHRRAAAHLRMWKRLAHQLLEESAPTTPALKLAEHEGEPCR
jgi:AcrR family transcriptional regulator